ncbi:MAG: hypothetical protein AAGD14_04760 [Planctomycetota bacterium]
MGRIYKVVDTIVFIICLPVYAVAFALMMLARLVPHRVRDGSRRFPLREGRVVSRFIARDVRRDILVVSTARIDEGYITGRVRTTNLLYQYRGLVPESEFGESREIRIDEMWHWTGKSWGGLPDGTSIVDHPHRQDSDSPRG